MFFHKNDKIKIPPLPHSISVSLAANSRQIERKNQLFSNKKKRFLTRARRTKTKTTTDCATSISVPNKPNHNSHRVLLLVSVSTITTIIG